MGTRSRLAGARPLRRLPPDQDRRITFVGRLNTDSYQQVLVVPTSTLHADSVVPFRDPPSSLSVNDNVAVSVCVFVAAIPR